MSNATVYKCNSACRSWIASCLTAQAFTSHLWFTSCTLLPCRSLAGDLAWADHPSTSLLDWSDSSSEATQRVGGPRIVLDSHPMQTQSAAASPMGSLSPASSLRSSPGQAQPLTGSQARLPAFARTYDSPAFSPERRTQLASGRPDDAGHTGDASEVEQWMPRRSDAGSMNLSRLQGGLSNMLGMPVAPSRSPLPSPVSQSLSFPVTTAPAAGGPQMVHNVASPTSVPARNLRLFDSPAYAQSSHGSQASSSVQSSPGGPSALTTSPARPSTVGSGMHMVSNGLFKA